MGQNQSNTSSNAKKRKPQESEESDDDVETPKAVVEADPFIIAKINYELPNGQSEVKQFRIGTSKTKGKDVKRNLEKQFGIKENKIQVYLEGGFEEMPDKCTLHELGIYTDIVLRVRDGSKNYA